jgi:hypothetical protein
MVPRVGVEPTRCYQRQILNLLRLPISPPRHFEVVRGAASIQVDSLICNMSSSHFIQNSWSCKSGNPRPFSASTSEPM